MSEKTAYRLEPVRRAARLERRLAQLWRVLLAAMLLLLVWEWQRSDAPVHIMQLQPADVGPLLNPNRPGYAEVNSPQIETRSEGVQVTLEAAQFRYGATLEEPIDAEALSIFWESEAGLVGSLLADFGTFDPSSEWLDIPGRVEMERSDGLLLLGERIEVDTRGGVARSDQPVTVTAPQGRLSAQQGFHYDAQAERLTFYGRVELNLSATEFGL